MRRFIPFCCALLALATTASVALAQGDQPPPEEAIITLTTSNMPTVLNKDVDEARALINKAGIYADYDVEYTTDNRGKSTATPGKVLAQDPPAGDEVESGAGDPEPIQLTVYTGPKPQPGAGGCGSKTLLDKAIPKLDLQDGLGLLQQNKIKLQQNFKINFKVPEVFKPRVELPKPEIKTIDFAAKKKCDGEIDTTVPGGQQFQDLKFVIQPRKRRPTFDKSMNLSADTANFFLIKIVDRSGKVVNGAQVNVDGSDVGGKDFTGRTAAGKTSVKITPKKAGIFDMVASTVAGNGQFIYGAARVKVVDRKAKPFTTFLLDRFKPVGKTFKFDRSAKASQNEDDDKEICDAYKTTTGENCADDGGAKDRQNMTVVVLNTDEPISADIGVVKTEESTGIQFQPGDSTATTMQGPEIIDVLSAGAVTAGFLKSVSKFAKNAWAGVKKVGQTVVNNVIKPAVQGAAKAAGEFVSATAPFLAPAIGLVHNVLTGQKTPAKPPIGPPAVVLPPINVPTPPSYGQPSGTQAACDFGAVIISQYAATFLNVFKKYCQTA